ncbi:MAG: SDR family NAD(P)-dependent oxidoreductase [Arenicellales bacterium]|nr:SDR family NAD(P)-dependent oxidoreductase [Arenicellales bacterium]
MNVRENSSLSGKTAFVTGGSSGIGAAIVRELDARGAHVAFCARREDRLRRLADQLQNPCLPLVVDMRKETEIVDAFARIQSALGPLDVLVNNAGLGYKSPLSSGDTNLWREMLEVNVLALCIATREAVMQMTKASRSGHIVHVSSMAGHRVPHSTGMYSASKHAVRALTESLRMELREQNSMIRIGSVSPGLVETEFASLFHGSEDKAKEIYTAFQVLNPEDIADAVCYLLEAPAHMQIHDILIRPTQQAS